jgi:hypothetical protein
MLVTSKLKTASTQRHTYIPQDVRGYADIDEARMACMGQNQTNGTYIGL